MSVRVPVRTVRLHSWARAILVFAAGNGMPAPAQGAPHATPQSSERARTLPSADFERFFLAHEAQISGYLWRMTGDPQAACDLSQETFLRAWRHFDTIRVYDKPAAWLIRVATNLALQHLRRRKAPVGAAVSFDDALAPGESDPGRRFAERDLVRETLMELPVKPRALLVLREVYGLSGEEAAAALNMTREAAKVALWRARQQFRAVYLRKDGQS
jgi:RNA polymerase sigma-70 factor, ECF subfamily